MNHLLKRLWESSASLIFVGLLMLVALAISIVGLIADPRTITGAPAWLKPMKFALSTGIYSFTVAWLLTYISVWPRLVRFMARLIAFVIAFEVVVIGVQAARGISSHFNVTTPLNATLFSIMGVAIGLLELSSAIIAVALFRQAFADRAWGWALRLGMTITVLGAGLGGMMLGPTHAQLEQARATHQMTTVGAHTVGAPDGGPGLPMTGWSTTHGDLRIPHFFGMHAVQIIPFLTFLLARFRPALSLSQRIALIQIAAAGYALLIAILEWQALRGQSILEPDQATLLALAFCAGATLIATGIVLRHVKPAAFMQGAGARG
jgi:hypothetical protein